MGDSEKSAEAQPASTSVASSASKKGGNKALLVIAIVLLVLCCLATLIGGIVAFLISNGSLVLPGQNPQTTNNNNSVNTPPTTPPANNDSGEENEDLGDFFDLDGAFDVRIDNVRQNGDDYEIEMSIMNTSDRAQTFSTLLFLNLQSELTEAYSQNFFSARYQDSDAQLDGEIAAGETKRGVVVYEVEDDPSSLTLRVSDGLFSDEYVDFKIK